MMSRILRDDVESPNRLDDFLRDANDDVTRRALAPPSADANDDVTRRALAPRPAHCAKL
jgi:hypothetical protein